jgi:hypothetical protein
VSDNPSVREWLQQKLTPLIPPEWAFIPNQKIPETISKVTVFLTLTEIEPLPEAPTGSLSNSVTLTVVSVHEDQVKAENALDDHVLELCTALSGHAQIIWTNAKKVGDLGPYTGWDVSLKVITRKED